MPRLPHAKNRPIRLNLIDIAPFNPDLNRLRNYRLGGDNHWRRDRRSSNNWRRDRGNGNRWRHNYRRCYHRISKRTGNYPTYYSPDKSRPEVPATTTPASMMPQASMVMHNWWCTISAAMTSWLSKHCACSHAYTKHNRQFLLVHSLSFLQLLLTHD